MRLSTALPVALLLLAGAVIALAPAGLVDAQIALATEGRARLADASGTLWRGAGVLSDSTGAARLPVAWRLSPLALLRGTVDLDVAPQGAIVVTGETVTLANVRTEVPASALDALAPRSMALAFGGELGLEARSLRFDGRAGDGALDVRWDRARVAVNGAVVDLGTVVARVTPRGADLAGTFTGAGGTLRTAGDFIVTSGQAGVNATLTPVGTLPPEIAPLLAALGPADTNGVIHVVWRSASR